ncbi:MAG: hypothetical protein Q9227_002614 [Pyrenula ochraceoflavens]
MFRKFSHKFRSRTLKHEEIPAVPGTVPARCAQKPERGPPRSFSLTTKPQKNSQRPVSSHTRSMSLQQEPVLPQGYSGKLHGRSAASESIPVVPNPAETRLPLAVGVEVEFLFVVRKSQSFASRLGLSDGYEGYSQPHPKNIRSLDDRPKRAPSNQIEPYVLRRILQSHLERDDCPTATYDDEDMVWDLNYYRRWCLKEDSSVTFENEAELHDAIYEALLALGTHEYVNWEDWDVLNSEICSRTMVLPNNLNSCDFMQHLSSQEISQYIKATADLSDTQYFTTINQNCGLHVHIGIFPPAQKRYPDFPIKVLQHLAYLLLQFEYHLTTLHPRDRHGPNNKYLGTNLKYYRGTDHTCGNMSRVLPDIQNDIFSPQKTINDLVHEMSHKNHPTNRHNPALRHPGLYVNWLNLSSHNNTSSKRTIEFRQHAGTLNPDDALRWVQLCASLVRAAERLAGLPPADVRKQMFHDSRARLGTLTPAVFGEVYKYPPQLSRGFAQGLEDLWPLLGLDQEAVAYWTGRSRMFGGGEVQREDCRVCRSQRWQGDEKGTVSGECIDNNSYGGLGDVHPAFREETQRTIRESMQDPNGRSSEVHPAYRGSLRQNARESVQTSNGANRHVHPALRESLRQSRRATRERMGNTSGS